MRAAVAIIGVTALAAGVGFIALLYEVGRDINQYRTCGNSCNR